MRYLVPTLLLAVTACGTRQITFDPAADAGPKDGAVLDDSGNPIDGSAPPADGAAPDGGTTAKPALYTSGTRLKTRYYLADDGAEQQVGLYDTQLQTNCFFSPSSDGSIRCIPVGFTPTAIVAYFSDAACTTPIAAVTKGCAAPKNAYGSFTVNGCGANTRYRAYPIGGAYVGATYALSNSVCVSVNVTSSYDLYAVGAEIPPASMVGAQEKMK